MKIPDIEEAIKVSTEVVNILEAEGVNFTGDLGEVFSKLTGLPKSAPPLLAEWAFQKNNVGAEHIDATAFAMYDLIITVAAIAYAHGKKVSQTEATETASAASNSAQ